MLSLVKLHARSLSLSLSLSMSLSLSVESRVWQKLDSMAEIIPGCCRWKFLLPVSVFLAVFHFARFPLPTYRLRGTHRNVNVCPPCSVSRATVCGPIHVCVCVCVFECLCACASSARCWKLHAISF